MNMISRKFIYVFLIFSLALPVSALFDAVTLSEVYAAKKDVHCALNTRL